MELKQYLKLTQQLVMTPQLQQAIKLLQLSRMELSQLVREQLNENPILDELSESSDHITLDELENPQKPSIDGDQSSIALVDPIKAGETKKTEEISWDQFVDNYNSFSYGPTLKISNEEFPSIEGTFSRGVTLTEHLTWQLHMSMLNESQKSIALYIIGNINEDGYFVDESVDEIALKLSSTPENVEKVLTKIQEFDPVGVAARDLKECLLIQAKTFFSDNTLVIEIITNHLKNVEKKNYQPIAKDLKCSLTEVIEAIKIISGMEPKPGRIFHGDEAHYIIPDVNVYKVGDEYIIVLNEDGLPKLRISSYYQSAIASHPDSQTKEFIQDKFKSAVWLIRSIHQRQNTIRKVTESIMKFQRDFLDKGVAYLRPLILRDVAEDTGLHESTVSRVTTNKYVNTVQGIFELKFFFNSRVSGLYGDDVSSESVKVKIKKLIESEDPKIPLSDQQIVKNLKKENIDIARRTVAKYRETLGILPSSKRKVYF